MADFDTNPIGSGQKTRGNRFDRADFIARQPPGSQFPGAALPSQAVSAASLAAPAPAASQPVNALSQPSVAAPAVGPPAEEAQVTADHLSNLGWSQAKIEEILGGPDQADDPSSGLASSLPKLEAYLAALGWSKSDVARLLVGPEKAYLMAEALFRQHAANPEGDQKALLQALSQAGARSVRPDPSLLSGLDVSHLNPETPLGLDQIISQFATLPDVQKKRFLLLLDSQKPDKKTAAAKSDGTAKPSGSGKRRRADRKKAASTCLALRSRDFWAALRTGPRKKRVELPRQPPPRIRPRMIPNRKIRRVQTMGTPPSKDSLAVPRMRPRKKRVELPRQVCPRTQPRTTPKTRRAMRRMPTTERTLAQTTF